MSATTAPAFTFAKLRERTEALDGPTRMAVFYELPATLQREAWDTLAERMADRAEHDFELWCRDVG